jgi:hypothetical protein
MNTLDLNTGVNTWLSIGISTLGLLIFISILRSYFHAQRSSAFLRVPGKLTELQYTGKTKQSKTGLFTRYEFVYEGKRYEAHRTLAPHHIQLKSCYCRPDSY